MGWRTGTQGRMEFYIGNRVWRRLPFCSVVINYSGLGITFKIRVRDFSASFELISVFLSLFVPNDIRHEILKILKKCLLSEKKKYFIALLVETRERVAELKSGGVSV